MANNKKRKTSVDNEPISFPEPMLTAKQVTDIVDAASTVRTDLLEIFRTERVSERYTKLLNAVNAYDEALRQLSNAYVHQLGINQVSHYIESTVNRACHDINDAKNTITSHTDVLSKNVNHSYANVAAHSISRSARPENKVSLGRGKSLPISRTQRIVIGPRAEAVDSLKTAAETKEAFRKAIDPVALKLRVNRFAYGQGSNVILEGDDLPTDRILNCPSFAEAGLEIKTDDKMKPRLLIHDIPVEYDNDRIARCIADQNLSDAVAENIKIVYHYPAGKGDKETRSCVVEVEPTHRVEMLSLKKLYVGYARCRVVDHLTIRQCYKCYEFNHIAADCQNKRRCCFCAGEHESSKCSNRRNLKCCNCAAANKGTHAHSATDKTKCPILQRKIDHKMSNIDYGN